MRLKERNALTCACALLLGSLYPALRARDDLARQRDLLMRMNEDSLVFKNQLRYFCVKYHPYGV